jgi:RimJ/RimL family protein N-acetyltransferase
VSVPGICIFDISRQDDCVFAQAKGVTVWEVILSSDSRLPLGAPLPDWTRCPSPQPITIDGRYCRIEPLNVERHVDDLVAAFRTTDESSWVYLFIGPFEDDAGILSWLTESANSKDYIYSAIIDRASGRAAGLCAYMRPDPANGVLEIGSIHYSDALKRTPATTEAMYLLMRHVFEDLGYRRYEWKCNSFNAPSRRTALRLGFRFEGIFRNHMVVKGHNRDTAWFSILDNEWPVLKSAYEKWLAPENFDREGRQRMPLADMIAVARG